MVMSSCFRVFCLPKNGNTVAAFRKGADMSPFPAGGDGETAPAVYEKSCV